MDRSAQLLARARKVIPGGVNSPVRAYRAVGGDPPFAARGEGVTLIDEDGNRYLDLVCSWGALLLGHVDPTVHEAAVTAAARGSTFGAPTEAEIVLAERIVERVPSMERVRLVSSGTEATMHAIRLARGVTGRSKIIKLDGHYHGAHDAVLVNAGSGVATFGIPGTPGVPDEVAALTLVAPFNDLDALDALFAANPGQIAAIILEPVAGNMGCIPPRPGYLEGVRALCDRTGALLVLDEVMTGFRVASGGAQALFGVRPDLTTLGKIVGGGYPLAAYGGRADLMGQLAPDGPVYQAGTLSGNPVAVAAGIATLDQLTPALYAHLERIAARIEAGIGDAVARKGCSMHRVGSMFTVFFCPEAPRDYTEAKKADREAFGRFFRHALEAGVYLPASQFEAAFLSARLTDADADRIVAVLTEAIARA
ncbi:MAG: glutamate-1-semialdehyde 2,1-aminomutase [Deltaproteobacteria bacterium]|nr:glutamate-1-semialdehyde 2,1-aminomutase [Deltaproteobacteria bacterium]